MCGHVGIAGKLEHQDEATMKRLLLFDFFRGPDSTGMASIKKDNSWSVAKLASNPVDFFSMPKFSNALNSFSSKAWIGHNRAATRGVVNSFNAHPYEYDTIVGAHNGTLSFKSKGILEEMVGQKFDVDSQALLCAIDQFGVEEVIPEIFSGKDDAWSLVWYNKEDDTLNFLRNAHRPMWYCYTGNFKQMLWASEWEILLAATDMSSKDYNLYREGKEQYRFWSTPQDYWLRYKLSDLIEGTAKPKPLAKELKGKEPVVAAAAGTYSPFPRANITYMPEKNGGTTSSTTKSRSHSKTPPTVVHLYGDDDEPLANFISRAAFDLLTKDGCSFCQKTVEYDDEGLLIFEKDQVVLCPECADSTSSSTKIFVTNISEAIQ